MELRPYQKEAIKAVFAEWTERQRTLLVLPTGTGKTIVFTKIAERCARRGDKVLILAHRNELLQQAADKIYKVTGMKCSVEKAEKSCIGEWNRLVVGSVQTLQSEKRLAKFPADYFDVIIIDEAHHVMSQGYKSVLEHFDKAKVLGVTATPDRGDMKNLGEVFESLAYEYTLPQAIKDGYLVPIKALTVPLSIDISQVKISQGDFAVGEIGTALDPYLEQIADAMKEYCKNRKTVVFLPLIKTSKKFTVLLNHKGFSAAEVNGNSKDREETLKDFDEGRYNVLCNSMLLTEGWDCPSVDCVIVLRPTKVRALYSQMIGRGTRLFRNKKDLLILDFLWHTSRLDLCSPTCLISKNEKVAKKAKKILDESKGEAIDLEEVEKKAQEDIIREREEALAKELEKSKKKKKKLVDPLQFEMSISAEDLADYVPSFGWEMGPATDKQRRALDNFGVDSSSVESCGKAKLLLDRLIKRSQANLATPRQIKLLERYHFKNVGTWHFIDANNMISRIAQNNWRVPRGIRPSKYKPARSE